MDAGLGVLGEFMEGTADAGGVAVWVFGYGGLLDV